MRSIAGLAFAVLSIAACSAGDNPGSRSDMSGGAGLGTQNGSGGKSGGPTGSGGGDFGNNAKPPVVTQLPPGADAGEYIDGGLCMLGEYCGSGPDGDCGSLTLASTVKITKTPGNVLLIFDRSFSMTEDWNGMKRWQGAGSAMIAALMPLADMLTIGGVMYPSKTPGPDDVGLSCAVDPFSSAEQLTFQPGVTALQQLQTAPPSGSPSPLYGPIAPNANELAVGATPTTEAIIEADVALQGATLTGTTVAVLITDGEPNCGWDEQKTTDTVASWLTNRNIKTYVVGLPGIMGNGPAMLNAVAQAGGTDAYIDAVDTMTLQTKLADIVQQTVKSGFDSCTMELSPAAKPVEKLQLVVSEKGVDKNVEHDLGNGAGWTVSPDGLHVELIGSMCDDAKGGRFETVKFEYGCKELPPLPREPPPD